MTQYRTHKLYADADCAGAVLSLFIEPEPYCLASNLNNSTCYAYGSSIYYEMTDCTTASQADLLDETFSGSRFVAFNGPYYCEGEDVETFGFLATGECQPQYGVGSAIASVDDQGFKTLEYFGAFECTGPSYSFFLRGDDTSCVRAGMYSYKFYPSSVAASEAAATSGTGVVVSTFAAAGCAKPATTVYIEDHPSCSKDHPTSTCTLSFADDREVFFSITCMDNWRDRDARKSVLEAAFGGDTYLAVDSFADVCGDDTVNSTYAFLADGECHDAFGQRNARVEFAVDGSAIWTQADPAGYSVECTDDDDDTMTSIMTSDIAQESCVASNGTMLVFYTTSDIVSPSATSSPTDTPAATPGDGSSAGILGLVVGVVGVAIAVVALLFVWRRLKASANNGGIDGDNISTAEDRLSPSLQECLIPSITGASHTSDRRTQQSNSDPSAQSHTTKSPSPTTVHASPSAVPTGLWDDPVIVGARVPREKVVMGDILACGGFGVVYAGSFNARPVAIKMLLPETRRDLAHVNIFLAEVKLIATLDHPCIVQFIGVAWDSLTDLCVLSEFMDGGDLRTFLSNLDAAGHPTGFDDDKLRIACNVAHALTYLHSLNPIVIHRDLKSRNVLLSDATLDAKLTDFGVSRERAESTMTAAIGTSLWMAPEVMLGERYDEKADVFSFGVLLSEIDTHALPYSHAKLSHMQLLQLVASGTLSVLFSTNPTDERTARVVAIGKACMATDPSQRPTAAEVGYRLTTILRSAAA